MKFRSEDFIVDGSMRDVCILNAGLPDWQNLIDALRDTAWTVSFTTTLENAPSEVLDRAEVLFDALTFDPDASATLAIQVDDIWFTCYFFEREEIEFTFHTEDVANALGFASLSTFVRWLGDACGRRVVVTVEGTDHASMPVILEYLGTR